MRKKLVKLVRAKGIADERVLAAIEKIPRHFFVDDALVHHAYEDKAFPIGEGQTISQPYTVARQTELLQPRKDMVVLEIGTGSGYQACVLAELGVNVLTIERHKILFERSKQIFDFMDYKHIHSFYGDGYKGLPMYAPFDGIIITAAADEIPSKLLQQLKKGGRMVVPYGKGKVQQMMVLKKDEEGMLTKTEHGRFSFVPMLKGKKR